MEGKGKRGGFQPPLFVVPFPLPSREWIEVRV